MADKPHRIRLIRKKGWRKPENTVVVARPGTFGNPFKVSAAHEAGFADPRQAAVDSYRDWLAGDPWGCGHDAPGTYEALRQSILSRLPELRGKNLACWCPLDQPCHADVLLELANREPEPSQ